MNRTRVKICGITRVDDALAAVEAGADAIGMVFWSGSKRAIDNSVATEIARAIPPSVSVVGVFVDAKAPDVIRTARDVGITAVQLCGKVDASDWIDAPRTLKLLRSVAIAESVEPERFERMARVDDYLLDHASDGKFGGTGESFDWAMAKQFRSWGRIWLAGGLTSSNVGDAIKQVRPHAVDVSSGVESAPGIKSVELIRAFIDAVHRADHALAKGDTHVV